MECFQIFLVFQTKLHRSYSCRASLPAWLHTAAHFTVFPHLIGFYSARTVHFFLVFLNSIGFLRAHISNRKALLKT